jgi:hypothetical protein
MSRGNVTEMSRSIGDNGKVVGRTKFMASLGLSGQAILRARLSAPGQATSRYIHCVRSRNTPQSSSYAQRPHLDTNMYPLRNCMI